MIKYGQGIKLRQRMLPFQIHLEYPSICRTGWDEDKGQDERYSNHGDLEPEDTAPAGICHHDAGN